MADSASTELKVRLMEDGVTSSWGDKVDTNMQIIEHALTGSATASLAGSDWTLSDADYTEDEGKASILIATGSLGANRNIVIPNKKKFWVVKNDTSGAYTVTVKTSGGTGKTVTQSTVATFWCDGADAVYHVVPMVNATTGAPATSSGAAASSVSFTATGSISSTDVQAAIAELDADVTANTAALATKQDADSDLSAIAALNNADGNFIVGSATGWVVESGATVRASAGLSTLEDLLAAPGADRIALYDHSALKFVHATPGGGLTVSGTTVATNVVQCADAIHAGTSGNTTSNILADASIPQNTEGLEILTKSITPKSATNKLRIEATVFVGHATEGTTASLALFQDSTADALRVAAAPVYNTSTSSGNTAVANLHLVHIMDAGTTSSTTFKLRVGAHSGTLYYNATALGGGTALFSSASPLATLTITEFTA